MAKSTPSLNTALVKRLSDRAIGVNHLDDEKQDSWLSLIMENKSIYFNLYIRY